MNPPGSGFENAGVPDAERTLRLIATLPAPVGLEERVKAGLRTAPSRGTVLAWPFAVNGHGWMSGAAAAAIVLVVAGGGWGIYSHLGLAATPNAVVMPQSTGGGAGGFSAAGATRKPQTLEGPAVAAPVTTREEPEVTAEPVTKADPAASRKGLAQAKGAAQRKHAHTAPKAKGTPVPAVR